MQTKAEIKLEKIQKFFTPSLVFYPTFLALKFGQISLSKLIFNDIPTLKKWGKKLVRGVKNFCIIKYKHSTFICTKNQKKIFKIRKNILKWNLMTIKKKIWKFLKIFWKFSNFQNCEKWKKIQKIYFEYEFFQRNLFSRVLKIF